jgi:hypothetical protein
MIQKESSLHISATSTLEQYILSQIALDRVYIPTRMRGHGVRQCQRWNGTQRCGSRTRCIGGGVGMLSSVTSIVPGQGSSPNPTQARVFEPVGLKAGLRMLKDPRPGLEPASTLCRRRGISSILKYSSWRRLFGSLHLPPLPFHLVPTTNDPCPSRILQVSRNGPLSRTNIR